MWETLKDGELTLFTRPGKTQLRDGFTWREVDGLHYQWQRDGKWVGQGIQTNFAEFAKNGPAKIGIQPVVNSAKTKVAFDWATRVSEPVLDLPFVEGMPSQAKAKLMTKWVKAHGDVYANKFVKLYHATDPALPIESEGLKPTSATRRRSYQSASGFVYLANTPERAKNFGDLGNQGRSVVYEVIVRIRHLKADLDQLNNQRSVGNDVGNSIGESIIYGGGVRVAGCIEPWAIRKLDVIKKSKVTESPVEQVADYVLVCGTDSEGDPRQLRFRGRDAVAKARSFVVAMRSGESPWRDATAMCFDKRGDSVALDLGPVEEGLPIQEESSRRAL